MKEREEESLMELAQTPARCGFRGPIAGVQKETGGVCEGVSWHGCPAHTSRVLRSCLNPSPVRRIRGELLTKI